MFSLIFIISYIICGMLTTLFVLFSLNHNVSTTSCTITGAIWPVALVYIVYKTVKIKSQARRSRNASNY